MLKRPIAATPSPTTSAPGARSRGRSARSREQEPGEHEPKDREPERVDDEVDDCVGREVERAPDGRRRGCESEEGHEPREEQKTGSGRARDACHREPPGEGGDRSNRTEERGSLVQEHDDRDDQPGDERPARRPVRGLRHRGRDETGDAGVAHEVGDAAVRAPGDERQAEDDGQRERQEPDEDAVRERCAEDAPADRGVASYRAPPDLGDRLERPPRRRAIRECDRPRPPPLDPCVACGPARELGELCREGAGLGLGRHAVPRLVSLR